MHDRSDTCSRQRCTQKYLSAAKRKWRQKHNPHTAARECNWVKQKKHPLSSISRDKTVPQDCYHLLCAGSCAHRFRQYSRGDHHTFWMCWRIGDRRKRNHRVRTESLRNGGGKLQQCVAQEQNKVLGPWRVSIHNNVFLIAHCYKV